MMLDLLKKSRNSKLWNFFNKRIFDLQLEKFLSPKIFLFNFDKFNIDVNDLYSYSKNFPEKLTLIYAKTQRKLWCRIKNER